MMMTTVIGSCLHHGVAEIGLISTILHKQITSTHLQPATSALQLEVHTKCGLCVSLSSLNTMPFAVAFSHIT